MKSIIHQLLTIANLEGCVSVQPLWFLSVFRDDLQMWECGYVRWVRPILSVWANMIQHVIRFHLPTNHGRLKHERYIHFGASKVSIFGHGIFGTKVDSDLPSFGVGFAKDLKDDHGWTVLMWAALAGSLDICDSGQAMATEVWELTGGTHKTS